LQTLSSCLVATAQLQHPLVGCDSFLIATGQAIGIGKVDAIGYRTRLQGHRLLELSYSLREPA
jgi:hypothetical protein